MVLTTTRQPRLGADLIKGALAGAAATWVMGKATTWMYEWEGDEIRERESAARNGKSAYVVAAQKASDVGGIELSEGQKRAGSAIHWALGIAAGAIYGVLRRRVPAAASGKGLPFGAGFFLVIDEFMNPAFGFSPSPSVFPWQTHARGLGGHLVFGLASEAVLEDLDRVA
jgi:hypothetical protein